MSACCAKRLLEQLFKSITDIFLREKQPSLALPARLLAMLRDAWAAC